ncbi:MAG: LPS-assembly protein LptD [Deltaproteobacteria bacterium]|nr:LPS-assembly protein LptD [Deltaproteobacteria bacterium]
MPNRYRTIGILIFLFIILGLSLSSQGADGPLSFGSGTAKEPWDIEARELSYDKDTDIYTAVGEVVIKKGPRVLKCDYAQVNHKTMIAQARGHVEFISAGDELRGDALTVDLKNQTGEVTHGRLFLKKNNFHITGERIWKTGEQSYKIMNGTLTSCDGENVPWEIRSKELLVTIDGYGQAWHPTFRIKKMPVLYAPYALFPAKTTRQSGFLIPEPGYSSRDGLTLNLPFYWAISGNTDATFYEYMMSRRGFMQGAEYRYVLSPQSKGTLIVDYLFKDGLSQEEFNKGNISKPYSDRYWFRSKINQGLPANMDLKMDLDWVSDRDYLKEFRGTPNGLDRNRRTFLSEFYRDLDDETQLIRRNAAVITKNLGTYNFTGGFTYYQELPETNTTLNQLPYARFDGIKQEFWKGLFFQWGSTYNNYWRTNLDRGQVMELTPTLYYPVKFRNYLNMETSIGLTETLVQADNRQSSAVDSFGTRSVPNFKMDMSTDFQRIFSLSGGEVQKIKHNIRPQLIYNYVPEIKQDSLPTFVPAITKLNTVTYLLTNTLTGKSFLGKGGQGEDLFGYRDFLLFKLYQTYDINVARGGTATTTTTTTTGTTTTTTTTTTTHPFSNVIGELEVIPGPYLSLRSSAGWSPNTGQLDTQTHNLTVMDKKGNRAYVEYLAANGDQIRQINSDLFWKISSIWSANFLTRYSLDQNKNFETTFGVTYTHQCWGIKLNYTDTPDDKRILFSFSLKGLSEF